ncbi:MAG TPA: hypothetical protein VK574_01710 [Terracidiphilus sp.]|nr:hypothetical protein [Terracidiphilus sp.]
MGNDQVSGVSAMLMPNGPGAAAVLAASIGCFAIGVFSVTADKFPALAKVLIFYAPTGPLSGVSTAAIAAWLMAWAVLRYYWQRRMVDLGRTNLFAFLLLACGVLLTFPPIGDLF